MLTIKNKCRTDRGVSPIIATLLLIVIAVAAAVVTYTFVMGFLGSTSGNTGPSGQLNYDSYTVSGSSGNYTYTIYVRNTGGKSVTVDQVYIDGSNSSWFFGSGSNILDVGSVGTLYITNSSLNPAQSYRIKIVCVDGTALEFSVKQ